MKNSIYRGDYEILADLIRPDSTILDLGCGPGGLLKVLSERKNADCTGIDRDPEMISMCMEKEIKAFNFDFNECLENFEDDSFDYVILYNSLQESRFPEKVMNESLRVGKSVVIGFPNFAHINARIQLMLMGKTPVTRSLPNEWYQTKNLRFLSNIDFKEFCRKNKIRIRKVKYYPDRSYVKLRPNLFAEYAIFLIKGAD